MRVLCNAFSLNMIAELPAQVNVEAISLDEARKCLLDGFTSAVGHSNTALVFQNELGIPVAAERITFAFKKGVELIVGQYRGTRLPEGASTLPDGASIQWLRVTL